MQQRITLITLGVSDLKQSREFYENKFGWKPLPSSNDNIIFFQLNGIQLALFPAAALAEDAGISPAGSGFKKFSLAHNLRSEKEVDALIANLKANGVTILKEPQKVFWGGYSSYVADPDGNLWEFAFNPFMELDEEGNVRG
jgi:catechol 2,3-dioxygenase-like lactoylglutathione lyase family enzyme